MESWLAADTIRRMGFGHVIAAHRHTLIVERGVSFVAFGPDGSPLATEYAAGLFARPRRYLIGTSMVRGLMRSRPSAATRATGAVAIAAATAAARAADPTAPELAQALQKKYDGIKDFSADFTHAYEGGVLKKQVTERGHLLVKKPGKMRWDYTAPD